MACDDHDGGAVAAARTADIQRHGLRIDSGSLRSFGKHVGLLPGKKLEQLAHAISFAIATPESAGNYDRFASLTPKGRQQVFDLTEPVTSSFGLFAWPFEVRYATSVAVICAGVSTKRVTDHFGTKIL